MDSPKPDQDRMNRRIAFLSQVPLFAGLAEKELAALTKDLVPRRYARDETIFHQGDHNYDLYIVMEGMVRVLSVSPAGGETTINLLSTGDVVGEFATIDELPRSTTAKATEPCVLLEMLQERFLARLRDMPNLAMGLIRLLVDKLRWTTAYAETIAQYDAAGRLLHILLLYNERFGQQTAGGARYELDLGMNQEELASLVGARREWVNRILRQWRKRGLVKYDGGRITILDLPAVERERDGRIEANLGDTDW